MLLGRESEAEAAFTSQQVMSPKKKDGGHQMLSAGLRPRSGDSHSSRSWLL